MTASIKQAERTEAKTGPAALPEDAGVVLLIMGGPRNEAEIEPFLRGLFSDPRILQLPAGQMYQRLLAYWIAHRRAPKVACAWAAAT